MLPLFVKCLLHFVKSAEWQMVLFGHLDKFLFLKLWSHCLFIGKLNLTVLNGKVVRIFKTKRSRYSDTAKKCNNSDAPETLLIQVIGADYTFRKYSEDLISYIICLTVINVTYIYYCRVFFFQKLKTYK